MTDKKKLTINKKWKFKEVFPKVSAYTTTYNCLTGGYPIRESIRSFAWADEVVVMEGGSTDGTRDVLNELKEELGEKLQVHEIPIDLDTPGCDGQQKALSRAMCSHPFLIQFDIDEICVGSREKWLKTIKNLPDDIDILNLLVLEPYGSLSKLRVNKEHTPWKWRVFRNKNEITHGIPTHDRLEEGYKVYSRGGSDGCFPIHIVTNALYPSFTPKYLQNICKVKEGVASSDDANKKREYSELITRTIMVDGEPCILHLGHIDLKNKIKHYLLSWHSMWCNLYKLDKEDPKNNLYFPGTKIEDVTEEMIDQKVAELQNSTPTVGDFAFFQNLLDGGHKEAQNGSAWAEAQ